MPLESNFHFSQYSLQDYVDCPRRFQLRHLLHLEWPAVQTAPVIEQENRMEHGTLFHRMVQQVVNGIPPEAITKRITDPILLDWWNTFLETDPLGMLPERQLTEYTLSASFASFRILAKYDLLAIEQNHKVTIMDWKTSQHRPKTEWLTQRVQSCLYPMLLVLGGEGLNKSKAWRADQIEMNYWFVQFPDNAEVITYNQERYERDHQFINSLIEEIVTANEENNFPMTDNKKRCDYCQYRSYCERGLAAGTLESLDDTEQLEEEESFQIDFEQIGEIAF